MVASAVRVQTQVVPVAEVVRLPDGNTIVNTISGRCAAGTSESCIVELLPCVITEGDVCGVRADAIVARLVVVAVDQIRLLNVSIHVAS